MTPAAGTGTPSWPQLAAWMVLTRPARLSGRWRTVEGRRETSGVFVHEAPDVWLALDARGRPTEHLDLRHLLQPDPFVRDDDDYHRPIAGPEQVVHYGQVCWQVTLEPPRRKRGPLTMLVDATSGLRVQQRNDEHRYLMEVVGLQVDGELDPRLVARARQRRAEADAETDLYRLTSIWPPPSPAWFPWRRGWAEKDDCWVVEADAGEASVGRAPLGEPAPVSDQYEHEESLVVRLDAAGYSWAVAADPPLTAAQAREVVEATGTRSDEDGGSRR